MGSRFLNFFYLIWTYETDQGHTHECNVMCYPVEFMMVIINPEVIPQAVEKNKAWMC